MCKNNDSRKASRILHDGAFCLSKLSYSKNILAKTWEKFSQTIHGADFRRVLSTYTYICMGTTLLFNELKRVMRMDISPSLNNARISSIVWDVDTYCMHRNSLTFLPIFRGHQWVRLRRQIGPRIYIEFLI